MDQVCELIGNAVPPRYAKIAGREIVAALRRRAGSHTRVVDEHMAGQRRDSEDDLRSSLSVGADVPG